MKVDELRPIAPGTLERLCEVLGLDPNAVVSILADHRGALVVMLVGGRLRVVELVES